MKGISFNSNFYVDFGLRPEDVNTPQDILILGNMNNFFGGLKENQEIDFNGSNKGLIVNNMLWLGKHIADAKSKIYFILDELDYNCYWIPYLKSLQNYFGVFTTKNFQKCTIKKSEEFLSILKTLEDKSMKFNKIIMNPPYDGNLHLKIVEKAIKMLKDENSSCVNLSPVRWLQDPLAKYKKGSDYNKFESVRNGISELSIINSLETNNLFDGTSMSIDLGIYKITKSGGYIVPENSIIKKVLNGDLIKKHIEKDVLDGWRIRINKRLPIEANRCNAKSVLSRQYELLHFSLSYVYKDGYTKDKVFWTEHRLAGAGNKTYPIGTPLFDSIPFASETEANNFEAYTKTTIFRYIFSQEKVGDATPLDLPYLGSVENPRTHKMGYESDWTNEDLCKVFGITGFISDTEAKPNSEWETILEAMKPYMEKSK